MRIGYSRSIGNWINPLRMHLFIGITLISIYAYTIVIWGHNNFYAAYQVNRINELEDNIKITRENKGGVEYIISDKDGQFKFVLKNGRVTNYQLINNIGG